MELRVTPDGSLDRLEITILPNAARGRELCHGSLYEE